MLTKRIVILANSIPHAPCRCVAGREVLSDKRPVRFGGWVRAVSDHGDGELYEQEIRLEDGLQPAVLDVVDVPLNELRASVAQPENWLIARREPWRKVGRMSRDYLPVLEERPKSLWHAGGQRSDRILAQTIEHWRPPASLCLIRPEQLRLRFSTETLPESDSQKHRRRAVFGYHDVEYNLPLTDPIVNERFEEQMPEVDEPAREFTLSGGDGYLLCVSLARAGQGYHYKVAATVIEGRRSNHDRIRAVHHRPLQSRTAAVR